MRCFLSLKSFSRGLLLAASPLTILASSTAWAQEVPLGPIDVFGSFFTEGGLLGDGDAKKTGTTKLSKGQLKIRTNGSGDPNEALKLLPNVQFQSHTTTKRKVNKDGGVSVTTELDLRPAEVSISGGRVYENNFMLDGVEINTVGGAHDKTTQGDILAEDARYANPNRLYFGHSQGIYIDTSILESITVHDSNISAEHGRFMGGVVEYKISDPKTDRAHFSFESLYTSDDLVHFKLATEDGENPKDRTPPDFSKLNFATSFSAPLSPTFSVLGSFSRRTADATQQRHYKFSELYGNVSTDTETFNMLGKALLKTEMGKFTLQTVYAPYTYHWESPNQISSKTDIKGDGWSSYLKHEEETNPFAGLFGKGKVESQFSFNATTHGQDMETNVVKQYTKARVVSGIVKHISDNLDDICRNDTDGNGGIKNTTCGVGGFGDLYQNQNESHLKSKWSGSFLGQQLLLGGSFKHTELTRERPEDATQYTATTTENQLANPDTFSCSDPNDPLCFDNDQYAKTRVIYRAFETAVEVNALDTYAEYDMQFGMFGFRAGGRVDYENYFKNINLSPRLMATIEPLKGLVFSGGFNRYFNNSMLAYAMRDAMPRAETYNRSIHGDVVTNEEGGDGWNIKTSPNYLYRYADSGLDTPYTDEKTIGLAYNEPMLGGLLRLRYIERKSKDEFSKSLIDEKDGVEKIKIYKMINEGEKTYRSYTAEYSKYWNNLTLGPLQTMGFSGSATWAKRHETNVDYFAESLIDEYIIYKGQVYTKADFKSVTGNLDIPVRLTFTANATLFNDWLNVWSTANVSLSYEGVIDSGSNQSGCGPNGESCDILEDYSFKPEVAVNIGGDIRLAKGEAGDLKLNFKVNNVLDSIGNNNAGDDNPFKKGRQFWLGMKYTY